jgi:lysophospholipase L1-like esterase
VVTASFKQKWSDRRAGRVSSRALQSPHPTRAEIIVKRLFSLVTLSLALLGSLSGRAAGEFKLDDGDRVVFLGSTLIEREQRYGWWELALTTRFAGKKITFRNLGWSGDTVFGESHVGFAYTRSGSANVPGGFRHLIEHTLHLKPTVLIIGYGTNESFEGEKGLPKFVKGLNTLLDALAPATARVVLLSPMRQGDMGRPLPDPAKNNKNLRLYADAIRDVAKKRGAMFVDLYDLLGDPARVKGVTENGIHLTGEGYRWSAPLLEKGLVLPARTHQQTFPANLFPLVRRWHPGLGALRLLPLNPPTTVIPKLPPGKHTLFIDDKPIFTADAKEWASGVKLEHDPEIEQAEKLRKLIVAKNELYFHRWRPQNETYLFGFRKHEQGKNASEIPKFDPLIEAKEKDIVELSVPKAHTYELKPAK